MGSYSIMKVANGGHLKGFAMLRLGVVAIAVVVSSCVLAALLNVLDMVQQALGQLVL